MPNTLSAERRTRSTARRQQRNRAAKSKVRTMEKRYLALVSEGKKEDADLALREVTSALDKAAKKGAIHWAAVNRKKSRLALKLA
jgi:small subunit ribosomal protein S20